MAFNLTRIGLVGGLVTIGLFGQSDWSRVEALAPGTPVTVSRLDGSVQKGLLNAAMAGAIRLGAGSEIAKPEVKRVADRSRNHRLRNTLIGAAIGVGAGTGVLVPSHPTIYRKR